MVLWRVSIPDVTMKLFTGTASCISNTCFDISDSIMGDFCIIIWIWTHSITRAFKRCDTIASCLTGQILPVYSWLVILRSITRYTLFVVSLQRPMEDPWCMLSTCVQHWLFPNGMQHHSILNNDSGTFTDAAIHGYENVLTPPRYLHLLQIDLFAICLFVSLHKL